MVEKLKKQELILPMVFGLLFSLLYFVLPIKYLAIAVLGLFGVCLVLFDVRIGLMAGVFVLPFLPDVLGLLYMFFLLASFFFEEMFKEKTRLTKSFMDLPIVLYFIIIVTATITSIDPMGSLRDLALHCGGLSFLFVMVNKTKTKEEYNRIITALVFTGTLVALYGLYQYVIGVDVDPAWVDVESSPDVRTRVYSVFYNPNILAEYLIMIIPLSVGLFWYTKKLGKKLIFLATSLVMALALVLTLSRGGWLGFAFSALIFVLLVDRRLLLLAIPVFIGGIYLLPQSIINRILSIGNLSDSSNAHRLNIWRVTLQMIEDNWKAGVGFGYQPFKYTFETYIRTLNTYHAHNTLLEVAAELGIPGLIAFIGFIFTTFKYGILRVIKSEDRYIKIMGAGALSALAGVLFHGLVENILYIPRIIITFWMIISFILTLARIEEDKDSLSKGE